MGQGCTSLRGCGDDSLQACSQLSSGQQVIVGISVALPTFMP
jgi:hypothetical protein